MRRAIVAHAIRANKPDEPGQLFTMGFEGSLYVSVPAAPPPGALREWLRSKLKKGVVR